LIGAPLASSSRPSLARTAAMVFHRGPRRASRSANSSRFFLSQTEAGDLTLAIATAASTRASFRRDFMPFPLVTGIMHGCGAVSTTVC